MMFNPNRDERIGKAARALRCKVPTGLEDFKTVLKKILMGNRTFMWWAYNCTKIVSSTLSRPR